MFEYVLLATVLFFMMGTYTAISYNKATRQDKKVILVAITMFFTFGVGAAMLAFAFNINT